VSSSDHHGVDP